MEENIKKIIKSDIQIKKFSAYGFLRNLTFFKPYLLIYLMSSGLNLFEIGLLYSIREIIIYVFEVPSGIIADYFGRKKELYMCFSFYIISFVFFFISGSFYISAIAMIFFGLGEAFRSGTHKAMILSYLEKNNLKKYKTLIYGRTRSFSLIGSALSSLLAIAIILYAPASKYIFALSIIPYIIDLIIISTYPNNLDRDKEYKKGEFRNFIHFDIVKMFKNVKLAKVVINQSLFTSVVKTSKDMVQPVLLALIMSAGFKLSIDADSESKVIIGLFYFAVSLAGAYGARNIYKINKYMSSKKFILLSFVFLASIITFTSLSITMTLLIPTIILFFLINVINDVRKPVYFDVLDNYMDKSTRATVISIEYQLTAILTVVLAPVFGYIANEFDIWIALLATGLFTLLVSIVIYILDLIKIGKE